MHGHEISRESTKHYLESLDILLEVVIFFTSSIIKKLRSKITIESTFSVKLIIAVVIEWLHYNLSTGTVFSLA